MYKPSTFYTVLAAVSRSKALSQADQQVAMLDTIPEKNPIQQKTRMSPAQAAKDKWKRLIWYAKRQWAELNEADLFKTEGDERKLIVLVKERYALKHEDALLQVKTFFAKNINR